eukprot:442645_1
MYHYFHDDLIHLKKHHEQHLFEINQTMINHLHFKECNPSDCELTVRHSNNHTRSNKSNNQNPDHLVRYYQHIFDSLHFFLLHLYQMGLRSITNNYDKQNDQKEVNIENKHDLSACFDEEFAKRKTIIASKRKQMGILFDRFETETNKFNIDVAANNKGRRTLYLDSLFNDIKQNTKITNKQLYSLHLFITNEQYDSDAVKADMHHHENIVNGKSNILKEMDCVFLKRQICEYVKSRRVWTTAFSTGFIFFYWPRYDPDSKEYAFVDKDIIDSNGNASRIINYGGYSAADLYVKQGKHMNLKEEIFDYGEDEITMEEYQIASLKADKYSDTEHVKRKVVVKGGFNFKNLSEYYNLPENTQLSVPHLMVLILYCDYSKLSTSFSKTFRKNDIYESISSVKRRNQKYWWMSRLLRETVEIFGIRVKGTFYCGMSCNMEMPAFSIQLCGPTSTTKQIEISMNFAKNTGIIIELSNRYCAGGRQFLRHFDVSWISRYKEEDERLWAGGQWPIQIRTIRNTATLQNFSNFFRALFWFDAGLNGVDLDVLSDKLFTARDKSIVDSLIDFELGYQSEIEYPKYITDTFHAFCINKKTISLNMMYSVGWNPGVHYRNTLFDSCGIVCVSKINKWNKTKYEGIPLRENLKMNDWNFNSTKNILKKKIFNLFPNVTNIVIQSADQFGIESYSFSLVEVLKILQGLPSIKRKNQVKCTINALKQSNGTWLRDAYFALSGKMETDSFSIELQDTFGGLNNKPQHTLIFLSK